MRNTPFILLDGRMMDDQFTLLQHSKSNYSVTVIENIFYTKIYDFLTRRYLFSTPLIQMDGRTDGMDGWMDR